MCVCCSSISGTLRFIPRHWLADVLSSLVQLERFWVTCLRCPESGGRTTSSTRASPSMRTSCSATICRPRPHLEDIRPLQRSSSWPQGSTRCSQLHVQTRRLKEKRCGLTSVNDWFLSQHGVDSDAPLPYSHVDIAGSSGPFPGVPTGAPILAMATNYIMSDRI